MEDTIDNAGLLNCLDDPLISWAELPITQCIMRKLKARYDASEVRKDCSFTVCTARLHVLKAPESQFDLAHPVFREGKQIAADIEQYLRENEEEKQAGPVHYRMESTNHVTETAAPPHPHHTAQRPQPSTATLQLRNQSYQPQTAPLEIGGHNTVPPSRPKIMLRKDMP